MCYDFAQEPWISPISAQSLEPLSLPKDGPSHRGDGQGFGSPVTHILFFPRFVAAFIAIHHEKIKGFGKTRGPA
jgi:hypothetical protein